MRRRKDAPAVWNSKLRKASGSLFERLVADEEDMPPPTDLDELNARVSSIKRHLRKILNTSAGSSSSAPELGITDFNDSDVESNDMTKHVAASIRKCIEQFEPRISSVKVQHVSDPDRPLVMNFKIVGGVNIGGKAQQVQIDLLMNDRKTCQIP